MSNKDKTWCRSGIFDSHHLTAKSRGGKRNPQNIILFDMSRHNAWHFLFGNMTLDEIIATLKKLKHYQSQKTSNTKR